MKVLGIDTSTTTASVALVENGALLLEELHPGQAAEGSRSAVPVKANHAETLLSLVDRLLRRGHLALENVSALSVAIGPGSFTGLRIGLSTVKGLAYGWDIPVIGVPTLLAMAARIGGWNGLVCPFLDARKREVYAALFRKRGNGALERLAEDFVGSPERVMESLLSFHQEPCLLIGDGTRTYAGLILATLGGREHAAVDEASPSTAFGVARLAEERIQKGSRDSPAQLVPLYLRPSEAEIRTGRGGESGPIKTGFVR